MFYFFINIDLLNFDNPSESELDIIKFSNVHSVYSISLTELSKEEIKFAPSILSEPTYLKHGHMSLVTIMTENPISFKAIKTSNIYRNIFVIRLMALSKV